MGSLSSETTTCICGSFFCQEMGPYPDHKTLQFTYEYNKSKNPESELFKNEAKMKKNKKKNQVFLEGYIEAAADDEDSTNLMRAKSLTDEDLDELKGCLDLGFGFSYEEIPELCNTLPALELCYSMSQKWPESSPAAAAEACSAAAAAPIANWKISSPGDHPEDVKARLKFWAQAVACTVRLCS